MIKLQKQINPQLFVIILLMKGIKSGKTHRVFVPITSFFINDFAQDAYNPIVSTDIWDIPGMSMKLVKLSKHTILSDNLHTPKFEEEITIEGKPFTFRDSFRSHDNLHFNSGFLFDFHQKEDGSIMIMPHQFEDAIGNPMRLLRLFCPKGIFAPYAFIDNISIGIVDLHEFGQESMDDLSAIGVRDVPNFLEFFERYLGIAEKLRQKGTSSPGSVFENWYKRIHNAIYFFNQTYFVSKRNSIHPDAYDKNDLRLLYLCTALDSLIGTERPSAKKLSKKAELLFCNIHGNIASDIKNFYDERSHYIHAELQGMGKNIPNRTIEKFSAYIQKLILLSLELSQSEEFLSAIQSSPQTYWFSFYDKLDVYEKYSIEKITKISLEKVFQNKDTYDFVDRSFIKTKFRIWAGGGR